MNNKVLLGKRIKELRLKKNLCQEELAGLIGLEPSSLSNIETGKNYPLLITLEKISKVLDVNFYDIFRFSQNLEPNDLLNETVKLLKSNPDKIKDVYKIVRALTE